jgi:chromosome segregation ATPase
VDAAHDNRRQLGQLMVDEGFLTLEQLTQALAEQNRTGRPLGKVLVDHGFVSEGAVATALAEQHGGLLKTEFGISAGLHMTPVEPSFTSPSPEPLDRATRIEQLESTLRTVVNERDAFARSVDELRARLSEATPDPATTARISELESQLHAVLTERNTLSQKLNELHTRQAETVPDPALGARVAELEKDLQEVLAERNAFAENLNELQARLSAVSEAHEAEIAHVTDSAAARIDQLEAEMQAALAARNELETVVAELRDRADRQPEPVESAEEATVGRAHLLFVPSSSGYALIEFEGEDPPSGALLDVDGVSYIVRRIGASPFPGGRLRCVYLDPV